MNIRKPADHSILFSGLDRLMAEQLSQMKLYCEIGRHGRQSTVLP